MFDPNNKLRNGYFVPEILTFSTNTPRKMDTPFSSFKNNVKIWTVLKYYIVTKYIKNKLKK